MTTIPSSPSRRRVLATAAIGLGALPLLARAAVAKTPKAEVKYQFSPKGADHCALCVSFLPGPEGQGAGSCKVVDGPIQPGGWCELFSRR